jgi:DNA-directed RNA polymerase subunit RPC12/RpoP
MAPRPEYTQVDQEYREAQLSSRNDLMHRASEVDLWMRVIQRAVDDIVLFTKVQQIRKLSEDEKEYLATANDFIFDDEYRIPIDDYNIEIFCGKCKKSWIERMSIATSEELNCPTCGHRITWKSIKYQVIDETLKTMNLKELLALWDIKDIKGFRKNMTRLAEEARKTGIREDMSFSLDPYTIDELRKAKQREYKRRYLLKKKVEKEAKKDGKEEANTNEPPRSGGGRGKRNVRKTREKAEPRQQDLFNYFFGDDTGKKVV